MSERSYDAWSEFDPEAAQAIRRGFKTGDWSAVAEYDPAIADALQYAAQYNDWRQFDPQVAIALRAAIGQEQINAQIAEDRALAAEFQQLAAQYPDFGPNQRAVMEYAIKHEIANPEIAFKAWTSASGRLPSSSSSGKSATAKTSGRIEKIEARLDELKYRDDMASNRERNALQQDLKEARDEGADALFKANGDGRDAGLEEGISAYNEALNNRNRSRATRVQFGHVETKAPAMTSEMKNALMDMKARALFRAAESGQQKEFVAEYQEKQPSRKDREADRYGYDGADQALHDFVAASNQESAQGSE